MATITSPRIPRTRSIPREDIDGLPTRRRIFYLLAERADFVTVNEIADMAILEPRSALLSLRTMEKKGLVISRKDGLSKTAPVSFMLVEVQ